MNRRLLMPILLMAVPAGGLALAQAPLKGETALASAQREAREAATRSQQLERAAAEAGSEAERLAAEAEAMVAGIEASEARISAAEARLRILSATRAEQDLRLAVRQQPVIRLTAALQTMARRPPALALVQPGSIEDAARVRALLASTLPVIRRRTAGLRAEVAAARKLQVEAQQAVQALAESRSELTARRTALARLEERQRQRSTALAQSAIWESDRSIALTEEAREIGGRVASSAFEAKIGRELTGLPAPVPRPGSGAQPPQQAPYRMPVQGRLLTGFGEISQAGIHSRGLSIAAAPNAEIVAPRSGKILYAGRFRSYGEVVIVDHGGGWTTTIINLGALRVARGGLVEAGDPLGRADGSASVGVELRRDGRPQPIAPFIVPG